MKKETPLESCHEQERQLRSTKVKRGSAKESNVNKSKYKEEINHNKAQEIVKQEKPPECLVNQENGNISQGSQDPDDVVKKENPVDENHQSIIDESLLDGVEKTEEFFSTPTKSVKAESTTEEQYHLGKLSFSPSPSVNSTRKIKSHSRNSEELLPMPETPSSQQKKRQISKKKSENLTQRKKRKISLASDYDQLSDTVKSELCETTNFLELEPIDMVHDMDNVIQFEDVQETHETQEGLFVPTDFNSSNQNGHYSGSDECNDPTKDPLYIPDTDKPKDTKRKSPRITCTKKKQPVIKCRKHCRPLTKCTARCRGRGIKIKENNTDREENEEFSLEIQNILKDFHVQLMHDVPPQHKIDHAAGSRALSVKEKQLFESYGPLKRGPYTPSEDDTIKQNWEQFCKIHNWNVNHVEPFLYMRHGNKYYIKKLKERQKFAQFLAQGLPWRCLYSVHQRFRKLYWRNENTHRRYTEEEDQTILSYMKKNHDQSTKVSDLAKMLSRTPQSVREHYAHLQRRKRQKKTPLKVVPWTKTLISTFIQRLLKATLSEDLAELKDANIPKAVWCKLEHELNIDQYVLKTYWVYQLHMQLFCPQTIYMNDIKILLIEYIYGKGIGSAREIIWSNVAKYFEGMTSVFLCKTFFHMVREVTSKFPKMEFPEIIEYLHEKKIPEIVRDTVDKYLPRLKYKHQKIEIIPEDAKGRLTNN